MMIRIFFLLLVGFWFVQFPATASSLVRYDGSFGVAAVPSGSNLIGKDSSRPIEPDDAALAEVLSATRTGEKEQSVERADVKRWSFAITFFRIVFYLNSLVAFILTASGRLNSNEQSVMGFQSRYGSLGRKWLGQFQEYRFLDLPIIPGSHNSGTYKRATSGKCLNFLQFIWARQQSLSIADQLNLGVRALDFRLHALKDSKTVKLSHSVDLYYDLEKSLQEIKEFLDENETEFVILLVRIDWDHRFNNQEPQERIDAKRALISRIFMDSQLEFFQETTDRPLSRAVVSELAGKVLMFSTSEGSDRVFPQNDAADPHPQFIDFARYNVKDIWRRKRLVSAKRDLDQYMTIPPAAEDIDSNGILRGVAIDMTTVLQPAIISPLLNRWFLTKLDHDPEWRKRLVNQPIGVLLLDFVCPGIMEEIMPAIFRHAD